MKSLTMALSVLVVFIIDPWKTSVSFMPLKKEISNTFLDMKFFSVSLINIIILMQMILLYCRLSFCLSNFSITITTRGKLTAMKCKIIPTLIKLLDDPSTEVRLYALKLITTLSETPQGRSELLQSLEYVSKLKRDYDSPAVRKAAQIAEKSITWKPWQLFNCSVYHLNYLFVNGIVVIYFNYCHIFYFDL